MLRTDVCWGSATPFFGFRHRAPLADSMREPGASAAAAKEAAKEAAAAAAKAAAAKEAAAKPASRKRRRGHGRACTSPGSTSCRWRCRAW